MVSWRCTSFVEAFSAWVRKFAVRLSVESVLRYGLPPQFLGAIIEHGSRTEAKAPKALAAAFGGADHSSGAQMSATRPRMGRTTHAVCVSSTLDIDVC